MATSEYYPYPAFMMPRPAEAATAARGEEIKEYKIRVSSKYLDLTRQKLELTRLPREIPESRSTAWWNPKPTVEPLVDFWLEHYSWRDQESELNTSVPQFKISIRTSISESSLRIHFIHSRSQHSNAVPLLLIPPFPFTNLSLRHLINVFTRPDDAKVEQPFHLVIPSLPGLGFSDSLPSSTRIIPTAAEMLDALMKRLGYRHYIATNSGPSATPRAGVDGRITNYLATHYTGSCLGVHLISPQLKAPKLLKSPIEWVKWTLASVFHAPTLGYTRDDIAALQRDKKMRSKQELSAHISPLSLVNGGTCDPNTLAYALCDSPTGLLVFFLTMIRMLSSEKEFTPSELITMTELTWLPGPEGTMRLWAYCESCVEEEEEKEETKRFFAPRPKVSITVFLGDEEANRSGARSEQISLPRSSTRPYTCPAWGNQEYEVVWSSRVSGSPGPVAWERPQVIASGARNLAKAILKADKRLYGTAQLEEVVATSLGGGYI